MRVPDDLIGEGKVGVRLSFASWSSGNVAEAALEVPIVDEAEKAGEK